MDEKKLKVIREVHKLFGRKGLKLSAAESCTGGLISHYLTMLPGSSAFFEAGVVTYSAASKKKILGISTRTVSSLGVVSEETAREMADNIRSITHTDYSISTTGNLGPDVLEGKKKGLVYLAVSNDAGTVVRKLRLNGGRQKNRESAAIAALEFLVETAGKQS